MHATELIQQAKTKGILFEYVWWGIANRVDNTVLLNKNLLLPKFESYATEVITHELKHSYGYEWNDVKIDMLEGDFFKNIWFCLNHPAGFLQFIPISFYKGNIMIDFNLILNYVLITIITIIYIVILKSI